MHPERYPNDTPQPVDVPDLGPALGDGWRDLDVMTVGEVWLQLMLELRLDADDAGRAAAGWDGGIYRAWTDGTQTAVVLRTVWDSTEDAAGVRRRDGRTGSATTDVRRRTGRGETWTSGSRASARHIRGAAVGARRVRVAVASARRRLTAPIATTCRRHAVTKYVYDFSEGNKDMKDLLGGKGANLAEMTNMGLPVPPGFTITHRGLPRPSSTNGGAPPEMLQEAGEHLVHLAGGDGQAASAIRTTRCWSPSAPAPSSRCPA